MSYFERSDVLKNGREAVFSKEKKVKGLFELDSSGTIYRFAIEDDDINLYEDNILGDNFDLDEAMDGVKILNFNKVKTISKGAFESLVSTQDLEFYFEGEQIRIEEGAFGDSFQKLKKIKGLSGRLSLLLYNNCFKKFKDIIAELEFENVDIYLYGKGWKKENIEKLIENIKDDGKIHAPKEEGEFEIVEKFKELDDASLAKLSKNMIAAILEGVDNKESAKTLKTTRGITNKRNTDDNIRSWDKLDGAVQKEMMKAILAGMKKKGITIKAEVDAAKVKVEGGKLILPEACFDSISLLGDGMLDILRGLSKNKTLGFSLKNKKENRDTVKEAVKTYIAKNWNYVTGKGEEELGMDYELLMDDQELLNSGLSPEELLKVRQENSIESKALVEDLDAAKQNVANFLAGVKENEGGLIGLPLEECKRLRKSYMLIGKEYKHKDKEIVLQCKECIKILTKAINDPTPMGDVGMNNESERKSD